MDITLNDAILQTDDLCQNFTASSIDNGNKIRAINRATEYIQRRLALPSDKKIQSFYFYEDTPFYDCVNGFNELIQIYYNTGETISSPQPNPNFYKNRWMVMKDNEILRDSGRDTGQNQVALTTINGKNQLLMKGRNLRGKVVINAFDVTSGIQTSADIVNLAADNNIFVQPPGSLKFDINVGQGYSDIYFTGVWNIQQLLNIVAAYRMYVFFPTGTTGYFSNVELRLETDTADYYSMTTTTQQDGTAWADNAWSFLSFALDTATTVGTPNAQLINTIRVRFNHSGTFQAVTNMRVDYLYEVNPDLMNAMHYSAYKGTDRTKVTPKIILNETTDIFYFGTYAPDMLEIIALRAALLLFPQLRGDKDFWQMYKADFENTILLLGRSYPRTRTVNSGQTEILR